LQTADARACSQLSKAASAMHPSLRQNLSGPTLNTGCNAIIVGCSQRQFESWDIGQLAL